MIRLISSHVWLPEAIRVHLYISYIISYLYEFIHLMYLYIYMYIYIHIHVHTYIYIYSMYIVCM